MKVGGLLNWAVLQNVQESYLGPEPSVQQPALDPVFPPRHLLSFPPPPPPPREQTPIYSSWGSALRQRRAVPPTGDQMERGSGLKPQRPSRGSALPSPGTSSRAPATDSIIVEPNSASLSTQIRLRPRAIDLSLFSLDHI